MAARNSVLGSGDFTASNLIGGVRSPTFAYQLLSFRIAQERCAYVRTTLTYASGLVYINVGEDNGCHVLYFSMQTCMHELGDNQGKTLECTELVVCSETLYTRMSVFYSS